ncbi:MAG: aspartate aminotransferase family protein [Vulcanimicrobiota bacterium]
MTGDDIKALEQKYLAPTYRRFEPVLVAGQGMFLEDIEGKTYLDCLSGLGASSMGHLHPEVVAAMHEQTLVHVSNLYHTRPHVELAQRLCELSFADRVFFCNSGTEASEGALKFARKWKRRPGLVTFENSFHGRSMGALSVTSGAARRDPFGPLVPGVRWAVFNDLDSVHGVLDESVAAVIVEPVQGEGGIVPATPEFLVGLRRMCDQAGAALIFDEVQCGLGRTGTLWAHEASGISPDLMTLAKPLAAGLPIGVVLMTEAVAGCLEPGDHGSTFAAGPMITSVANRVLQIVADPEFLAGVRSRGEYLESRLMALEQLPAVRQVRGCGLMWGIELEEQHKARDLVEQAMARGVLIGTAGANSLRLLPPLVIEESHLETVCNLLNELLEVL